MHHRQHIRAPAGHSEPLRVAEPRLLEEVVELPLAPAVEQARGHDDRSQVFLGDGQGLGLQGLEVLELDLRPALGVVLLLEAAPVVGAVLPDSRPRRLGPRHDRRDEDEHLLLLEPLVPQQLHRCHRRRHVTLGAKDHCVGAQDEALDRRPVVLRLLHNLQDALHVALLVRLGLLHDRPRRARPHHVVAIFLRREHLGHRRADVAGQVVDEDAHGKTTTRSAV